jgi:hypothetical protein
MEVVLTASSVLLYDFSSLKTSYSIVKSYTVHIHASLEVVSLSMLCYSIIAVRHQSEGVLVSNNGNGGRRLQQEVAECPMQPLYSVGF